jgi:hypothetical protein
MPANAQPGKKPKPVSRPQFEMTFRPRSYRWPRRPRHAGASGINEVSIVRIALSTPHRDVVTLRARRGDDGRIRYRMIHDDAHGPANRRIRVKPLSSGSPLAFGELVELIDAAYYHGACADPHDQECFGRVIWGTLRHQFEHGTDHADAYVFFATVTSEHYPELEAYYRERLSEWCLEHCEEEENCRSIVRLRLRRG